MKKRIIGMIFVSNSNEKSETEINWVAIGEPFDSFEDSTTLYVYSNGKWEEHTDLIIEPK